jgi:hypothetical protein
MPIPDLSQVTVALQRLLELNMPLIEPGLAGSLDISTSPPEDVQGGQNVMSLYCYHLTADPGNRLRPRQPSQDVPVASSPMTLVLNYILTAHTVATGGGFNALAEQRLLGHAMKTLHDFPIIDDLTTVAGTSVMPDEIRGRGNRFEIIMMQLSPGDALNFWANEDRITVKPSGYYEVRAVELEPQPPTRVSGIVLSVGNFVIPFGQPALSATEAQVPYILPIAEGGGPGTLTSRPARVGPINPAAPPETNRMRLIGSALGAGVLRVRSGHWQQRFPGLGSVVVDLIVNAALGWSATATGEGVSLTLGDRLRFAPPDQAAQDFDLYPGLYQASWETTRRVGEAVLAERSNEVPFAVTPRITGMSRDGGGRVTLDLGGTWRLTRGRPMAIDPVAEPELDLLLGVDGLIYRFEGTGVAPGAGGFMIQDHAVIYQPNPAQDTPGAHPVRIEVDGISAQPFWVEVP